jgi:hypothetical protein
MTPAAWLLLAVVAAPPAPEAAAIPPGTRVRVRWSGELVGPGVPPDRGGRAAGRVIASDGAAITVRPDDRRGELRVPWAQVRALDWSARRESRGHRALKGAGKGLAVGALVGGALGLAAGGCSSGEWCLLSRGDVTALGAISFGALGTALGGLSGLFDGGDHWEPVPLGRTSLTVGVEAAPRGAGARVTLRF